MKVLLEFKGLAKEEEIEIPDFSPDCLEVLLYPPLSKSEEGGPVVAEEEDESGIFYFFTYSGEYSGELPVFRHKS